MEDTESFYDLIVIGGGSAGLTAAKFASKTLKKSVVLIEQSRLGGDCTWTGCVPSKSLLAAAKVVQEARSWGLLTSNSPSMPDMFRQVVDKIQTNINRIYEADDSPQALEKLGIKVISGSARFLTDRCIQVTCHDNPGTTVPFRQQSIYARQGIVICTGASPIVPTNLGDLERVNWVTYENVWTALQVLPKRLTVVGGGPVGCELAQAFSRLGSTVTIVAESFLANDDPCVGETLERVFRQEGITIVTGRLERVEALAGETSDGEHAAFCRGSSDELILVEGDVLLVAVGRKPRTDGLGLDTIGVVYSAEGGIQVDSNLKTSARGIYAAGDCIGDRQFTHYAGYQGAIAARNILLPLSDPGIIESVPSTTFTSPEVASVGLDELAAAVKYGVNKVSTVKKSLSTVDRAVCDGKADEGFFKIVYLTKTGVILGATIVAPSAGEMISEITLAIKLGCKVDELAKVMHPYPTYSLAIQLMSAELYYQKLRRFLPLYDILKRLGL